MTVQVRYDKLWLFAMDLYISKQVFGNILENLECQVLNSKFQIPNSKQVFGNS